MSLIDSLLGAMSGAAGNGQSAATNPLLQIALSMLANSGAGSAAGGANGGLGDLGSTLGGLGGLGGLINAFQRNGMGDQMQSWIGTGQNMPISPDQLQQVLGQGTLGQIAQQLGLSPQASASGLSELLPQLIDRLTPNGQAPQGDLGDVADIMARLGQGR
ncbi:MAG: YidB family protein [Burkholderiales bacterium]|nr:YidB family protein [Burkholderiales bacterium]